MNQPGNSLFSRDRVVDKPGIVGARWWHEALADQDSQIARRKAIRNILIAGAVIAGFGAMLTVCVKAVSDSSDEYSESRQTSLAMQKAYGWSFGAVGEPLVFDGVSTKPFEAGALHTLVNDLAPANRALLPFFQATLFQSPDATPTSIAKLDPSEAAGFTPLATVMKPMSTLSMSGAYARGKSVASLFASLTENGQKPDAAKAALLVDLNGPDAVAFAAGATGGTGVFDPVFLFDNWPHPRGVVRAQEALSAAAYYQPLFAEARKVVRFGRVPVFVLDRRRLSTYSDEATQFDNRYVAKLPTVSALKNMDVTHILYVVPARSDATRELDDINEDFVAYAAAGIDVKIVSLDMFSGDGVAVPPQPASVVASMNESDKLLTESGSVFYGGSRGSHYAFFTDYPWAKTTRVATARPLTNPGKTFVPRARTTDFSSGSARTASSPKVPTSFATVPVAIAIATGVIVGARYSRSGSWNRSSGGFGG